MSERIRSMI